MVSVVSSKSTPLFISSKKEGLRIVESNSNKGHYKSLDRFVNEEETVIDPIPSLCFSEETKKEETEDDTEDDEEHEFVNKSIKPELVEQINSKSTGFLDKKSPDPKDLNQSSTIETYSPQLNYSLYSPSPSVVSSVRSKKSSRLNQLLPALNVTACNSANSVAAAVDDAAAAAAAAEAALITTSNVTTASNNNNSCSTIDAAQNSTFLAHHKINQNTTTTSSSCSSSNVAKHIEMNIRSPPQPTQSTSRFMNALQRLRSVNKHQPTHHNSVAPADILKVTPSKSSLTDKIKTKLQQLDKKKNNQSLTRISLENQKQLNNQAILRSTSLSSLSNWSSKLGTQTKGQPESSDRTEKIKSAGSNSNNFSLTKSISSHRLYNKPEKASVPHRPRHPLRPIHTTQKTPQRKTGRVRFTKLVSVRETFSQSDYDRESDPDAVCNRLTVVMAQEIKEELNTFKLHEMEVHELSRVNTHFFI